MSGLGLRSAVAATAVAAAVSWGAAARADWLAGRSRAIARGRALAHDAPAFELAMAPRPRLRLGADTAVFRSERGFRLGLEGFLALESLGARPAPPGDVGRGGFEVGAAWSWPPAPPARGPLFELGVGLGRRSAFALDAFEPPGPRRPDDVPFGGGGWYLGGDAALRRRFAGSWELETRLTARAYATIFPEAAGAHAESAYLASALGQGALATVLGEVSATSRASARWRPRAGLHFDALLPHDDSASARWLAGALAGVEAVGTSAAAMPFLEAEAGHGQGLLVNRTELRAGAGVRLHAR
ncbi:MAG: hypothetical protein IT376_08795 [Polyangiaceae bacterium]|nr:hypothetical protein [Polyangiaceae bacterium]